MKYLSTLFLVVALGGLVVGFSISLKHNEEMVDEARMSTFKARKRALVKHRRRVRAYHAGVVPTVPVEAPAVVDSAQ